MLPAGVFDRFKWLFFSLNPHVATRISLREYLASLGKIGQVRREKDGAQGRRRSRRLLRDLVTHGWSLASSSVLDPQKQQLGPGAPVGPGCVWTA